MSLPTTPLKESRNSRKKEDTPTKHVLFESQQVTKSEKSEKTNGGKSEKSSKHRPTRRSQSFNNMSLFVSMSDDDEDDEMSSSHLRYFTFF